MKPVHVECLPDELLLSKLGFSKKLVTHHQGKSKVFHALKKTKNQLAMVDEDPGSPKTYYEKSLKLVEESNGINFYIDSSGNKVFFLNVKLEDWIISLCKHNKIKLSTYGLPEIPDNLHDVINYKLSNFSKLLDELIRIKNPSIIKLKTWLS